MIATKADPVLNPEAHPIVMWELTRACDLHCLNCSVGAKGGREVDELSTYEAYKTVDQIAALSPRELIITGGDPLERGDVAQIIDYARRRGLDPALVVSPTALLTSEAVARLKRNGLNRMILSIDGSTVENHDAMRGGSGTFEASLRAMRWAEDAGLSVEINTLITRRNSDDLAAIVDLIRPAGIVRWNLYFPVPVTASARDEMLSAEQAELLFVEIDEIRKRESFHVRVVEAPQYRRHQLQRRLEAHLREAAGGRWSDSGEDGQLSLDDSIVDSARGFVFISHAGDVRPSEFLLVSAGNLRYRPLGAIYRSSDLFVALRNPDNLTGKCGQCEYRHICGGSRARAWAIGDIFGDDPLCTYTPGAPMPLPRAALRALESFS